MGADRKGFTLVEVLVASAIIAILTVVGLMVINPITQFNKTRDARRKSDLAQLKTALQMYHNDQGEYPVPGSFPGPGEEWTRPGYTDVVYMRSVPGDPSDGDNYHYGGTGAEQQDFCLVATLQNVNDPATTESQTLCNRCAGEVTISGGNYVVCPD
jgi:general secretion pathway protein G